MLEDTQVVQTCWETVTIATGYGNTCGQGCLYYKLTKLNGLLRGLMLTPQWSIQNMKHGTVPPMSEPVQHVRGCRSQLDSHNRAHFSQPVLQESCDSQVLGLGVT